MNYFLTLALVLFVYMSSWFLVSLLRKRNDVADVAWGLGFVQGGGEQTGAGGANGVT